MSWSDDLPTFIIENGEPREAQRGDEATHVLISVGELAAHEAFYNLAIAQRNKAWNDLERLGAR
jgi:hypothetical protein